MSPSLTGFRIEALWAYVAVADDDDEGVIAFLARDGSWMPMVAADPARLESLRPIAEEMARAPGAGTIKLVKFTTREEIRTLEGGGQT